MFILARTGSDFPEADLTGRELAVLQLLAQGLTSVAIGHRLRAAPRTVEKHLEHIYRKLQVRDRWTAVRVAEALGLLDHAVAIGPWSSPRPPWEPSPARREGARLSAI